MKIDFRSDPKHARDYVVLDRITGEEIDDAIFFADDEAGVYRYYLRDSRGKYYCLPDGDSPAWGEVLRPIRIELKGRVDAPPREAKVYLVTETWCREEGYAVLAAFSTREKAEAWRSAEADRRVATDPDGVRADFPEEKARARWIRIMEVVEMPLDPAPRLEIFPLPAPIG